MHAKKTLGTVLGALLLAFTAAAQSMSISPGTSLTAGSAATIKYVDSRKANQTVVVLVIGGFPIPTIYEVQIHLDANGKGTGSWTVVSGWRNATFCAPGVVDIAIPIL